MPSREDYKMMHDDGVALLEIAKRMTRFSAEFLALGDDASEKVEEAVDKAFSGEDESDDEKESRKKLTIVKLKRAS